MFEVDRVVAAILDTVRCANRPVEKPRRSTSFEGVRRDWQELAEEVRESRRIGEERANVGVGSLRCQGRSSNLHESMRGYGREMDWSFGKVGK